MFDVITFIMQICIADNMRIQSLTEQLID